MTIEQARSALSAHWFFPAVLLIAAGDLATVWSRGWSEPSLLEAVILFDLAVVLPGLYLWCYRTRGKVTILRAGALSCLGIWVAGYIVPEEHHNLLSTVGFVRYVGLAVLLVIELKIVVALYRAAFSRLDPAQRTREVAKDAGMPEWAARIVAWEISLWRKLWKLVRRRVKRR